MNPVNRAAQPATARLQEPVRTSSTPSGEPPLSLTIGEIQGAGLRSAYEGKRVQTTGVVTRLGSQGFFMQAPKGEAAPGSRGIWVFTGAERTGIAVRDKVTVTGDVKEYKPALSEKTKLALQKADVTDELVSNDQPTTELGGSVTLSILERGLDLDAAIGPPRLVGKNGLIPPNVSAVEGIKFYEGMEGERVTIKDLLVVGPTNYGKFTVVTDSGSVATRMTSRGTLISVADDDVQPEAINVKMVSGNGTDDFAATPKLKVGDRIPGEVTGILAYDHGSYVLEVTSLPTIVEAPKPVFKTSLKKSDTEMLGVGVNCENLSAVSPQERFDLLARKIMEEYGGPDVAALQEIQDNDGPADTGTVSGEATGARILEAIKRLYGVDYEYVEMAPQNNKDGGEPGGNIRVAYLVDPKRFKVDRAATHRIGEDDPAFASTRKSLELHGTFLPTGRRAIWINNHWSSKGGSDSLFGERQPPRDPTAAKRNKQQAAVLDRAAELAVMYPGAAIVIIGDQNETPGESVRNMEPRVRSKIQNVSAELPADSARSYIFAGNAQTIDQVQVHVGTKVKVEIDDTNPRLPFGHPDRDADHGHTIVLVDMSVPKARQKRRAA